MKSYQSKKWIQYSYLLHKMGLIDPDQFKQIEDYQELLEKKKDRLT
jgi:hypothetical protein